MPLDATHDPTRQTFVPTPKDTEFPIQNLPYGVAQPQRGGPARIVCRIGDWALDLALLDEAGLFAGTAVGGRGLFAQPTLNALMASGRDAWRETRARISELLDLESLRLQEDRPLLEQALLPLDAVAMLLPAQIGDYTDFYASRAHATNVGTMFRGAENALMPNWLHLPVGYHGRASSVVVSGTNLRRPLGQTKAADAPEPRFGPSQMLDFELEVGALIGSGNDLGDAIPASSALDHVFGLVLVNDWSARDIQTWEYQPLGPFLAKNFGTSISPWVVTMDALEPFRVEGPPQSPMPLPYLRTEGAQGFDLQLEVAIQSAAMRATERLREPHRVCSVNFREMYWSLAQQIAHHTVGGCNLRPGDLLASGTISGPTADARGSLLEITWRGTQPLRLPNGEERRFLEDGDTVVMRGRCEGAFYRLGFGEVEGRVLPPRHQD
ncbi:MAG: fumarylacetoacetase [Chloroflexi bacterium]|nr:fumarylacetoacetase [Chloroflexota bacterium]